MKSISRLQDTLYSRLGVTMSKIKPDTSKQKYFACSFCLGPKKILFRQAKRTPNKRGQFVTLWKREGRILPFSKTDDFDLVVVQLEEEDDGHNGQLILNKEALTKHKILATDDQQGKLSFRIYPPWCDDIHGNKQAIRTQAWQKDYFWDTSGTIDWQFGRDLYEIN